MLESFLLKSGKWRNYVYLWSWQYKFSRLNILWKYNRSSWVKWSVALRSRLMCFKGLASSITDREATTTWWRTMTTAHEFVNSATCRILIERSCGEDLGDLRVGLSLKLSQSRIDVSHDNHVFFMCHTSPSISKHSRLFVKIDLFHNEQFEGNICRR